MASYLQARGVTLVDAVSAATPMWVRREYGFVTDLVNLASGNIGGVFTHEGNLYVLTAGSAGEVCSIMILLSCFYLLYTKTAQYRLFLGTIIGAVVLNVLLRNIFGLNDVPPVGFTVFSGALLYAAAFMVTDPVSAPNNRTSQWIYAVFIGMMVICMVFGTGVSIVHNATQDMLEKNKRFHRNRIICRAFLLPVSGDTAKDYAEAISKHIRIKSITDDNRTRTVYQRIDPENPAIGYDFSGMGFWDRIDGIIVLTQNLEKIINIQFFDHKETPGLGARIEEKWFTDQFKGVPIAWDEDVSDRVIIGSATGAKPDNQVDAITGATQTSMALKRFLNAELDRIRTLKIE